MVCSRVGGNLVALYLVPANCFLPETVMGKRIETGDTGDVRRMSRRLGRVESSSTLREQKLKPTGRQIAAARTLFSMTQTELAEGSNVSVATIKRMEASNGAVVGMAKNVDAVCRTLHAAGVIFVYENGYGPGVRMRKSR
jgi:hypothetical protein